MKKKAVILSILVFVIAILSLASIVLTSVIATHGEKLSQIQSQTSNLSIQNEIYKQKVLALTSLDYIASRAAEMGFIDAKQNLYVSAPTVHIAANE